jgi:hypothetical protein
MLWLVCERLEADTLTLADKSEVRILVLFPSFRGRPLPVDIGVIPLNSTLVESTLLSSSNSVISEYVVGAGVRLRCCGRRITGRSSDLPELSWGCYFISRRLLARTAGLDDSRTTPVSAQITCPRFMVRATSTWVM